MLEPYYCKKCGKEFYPTPVHAYRDAHGMYCCWTCFNHRNDKKRSCPSKPVEWRTINGDLLNTFPSAVEAAKAIGERLLPVAIRDACRNGKPYKGYLWNYKE